MNNNELYHYGVKGMRWGHHKAKFNSYIAKRRIARRDYKMAKSQYRQEKDKAYEKYEKTLNNIEKPYKKGQNLSNKDIQRELKAENQYKKDVSEAKARYKEKTAQERKLRAKRAVKVAAAAAGTALAVYGAYKVSQAIKNKNYQLAYDRGEAKFREMSKKFMGAEGVYETTRQVSARPGVNYAFRNNLDGTKSTYVTKNGVGYLTKSVDRDYIINKELDAARNSSVVDAAKNIYRHERDRRRNRR